MANEKNLKPIKKGQLSKEEAKRRGKIGGENSAKAKRERKTFRELYNSILAEEVETVVNGVRVKITKKDLIARQVIDDYLCGKITKNKIKGAEHIHSTIGEAPVAKVEQTNFNVEVKPKKKDIGELKKISKEIFGIDFDKEDDE